MTASILPHCHSLRGLSSNQINGTIPPELSNLGLLETLYAQNYIGFDDIPTTDFTIDRCCRLILLMSLSIVDTSLRIILLAPSHLSSSTSHCCKSCNLRIASFSFTTLEDSLSPIIDLQLFSVSSFDCGTSFLHCGSLRSIGLNQLTGTLPPQLGDLPQLQWL